MNYSRRVLNTEFNKWLDESVYYDGGVNVEKRKFILYQLCADLKGFLNNFGYSITYPEKDLMLCLARFIFKAQMTPYNTLKLMGNPDARQEDYDLFLHRLGTEEWNEFMNKYRNIADFDLTTAKGRFITYSIPSFAWFNVNIHDSVATQFVDDMLAGSDTEDEYPRQYKNRPVDPYLIDQQNNIHKYNRWD